MPESSQSGGVVKKSPARKELSTELRLLIACVLMAVVWALSPYFYKTAAPPPAAKAPAPQAAKPAPAPPKAEPPPAAIPAAAVSAQKEEDFVIETKFHRVVFTSRGGAVKSWLLKTHRAHDGKPLELVNTAAKVSRPLSFYFQQQKPAVDLNQALYQARPDPDKLGITFEFSDGRVAARKVIRFRADSYISNLSTAISESGRPLSHFVEWRGGFGDMAVPNAAGSQRSVYFNVNEGKLVQNEAKAAKDGPVSASGIYSFAGIEDTYFAAVFLPGGSNTELITFADSVATPLQQKEEPFVGFAIRSERAGANTFDLFVGPKDLDLLRSINPKLESLVDFGWFSFLAKPLFLIVNWVNNRFIHNYGWAIILVTIVLNFLLFPLKISSMKSMKKMQALQPQIAAINEKYKNVSIRDPRKAQQNQEVMELYRKHGVNPMGGCFPMLLQIPFFIAFYKVFTVSVEMRGASWLWVTDLSQPEHLPIKILPLAMIASQFVMQKMTPATSADPNQQRMMMIMPLVFGFMFYNFSSGLVLYYLTSNLVAIAQQWFFNRTSTAEAVARSVQASRKKNGRK